MRQRDYLVLLVEDDDLLARQIKRGLEASGPFQVEAIDSGNSPCERARLRGFDAMSIGLELRGLNGLSLCSELRTFFSGPILFVNGECSECRHQRAIFSGADDYLPRPVSIELMAAHLQALIRQRDRYCLMSGGAAVTNSSSPSPDLAVGDLGLEPISSSVFFRTTRIPLTRTEFLVLLRLRESLGRGVTRDELHIAIRKSPWNGISRIIDVHVHNIKRKLARAGCRSPEIISVHGVGYSLAVSQNVERQVSSDTPTDSGILPNAV